MMRQNQQNEPPVQVLHPSASALEFTGTRRHSTHATKTSCLSLYYTKITYSTTEHHVSAHGISAKLLLQPVIPGSRGNVKTKLCIGRASSTSLRYPRSLVYQLKSIRQSGSIYFSHIHQRTIQIQGLVGLQKKLNYIKSTTGAMEKIVAEISSRPHHRSVHSLEHPLISIQHGRTVDFRPNTSTTAQISEPLKFRKSKKYLKVHAGTHIQTPAGDLPPPISLMVHTELRLLPHVESRINNAAGP
jgi:hypothetical protein